MIDYATKERQAWIKNMGRKTQPTFGLLHPVHSPRPNAAVDGEYQRRAERAWAKTREIGGICG